MPISPTYSDVGVNISFQFYCDSCLGKKWNSLSERKKKMYRDEYKKKYPKFKQKKEEFYRKHPEAKKCVIYKFFMMCVCAWVIIICCQVPAALTFAIRMQGLMWEEADVLPEGLLEMLTSESPSWPELEWRRLSGLCSTSL